jgi:hypothetical protein
MNETDGEHGVLPGATPGEAPGGAPGGASPAELTPAWLDGRLADFGAPQAVIDGLILRLGFQAMARLIADRPALRAALLAEYRRQSAALRLRLIREEWDV